ncbi:phosphate propanoyltransferase [Calorimonas adulescens]|jgi:Propanediol utilisation protein PduL.|uniref:Phosphate propanoyltransferase n=1 Tax=Calorimonas adulescens TaxID=2606906 RepID=A0A5D8QHG1_9THEO|nr:phosphate propanoyltransferase [Calorimonas adulescens]TZE83003.1 phosphate propanoyltransferase [Calorimonas adulescens]
MDIKDEIIDAVVKDVISRIRIKEGGRAIPVGISNRHIHLNREDMDILFGKGYELTIKNHVNQPGQFAANETVCIAGPKGCFERVRILGPVRRYSQIEISRTDAFTLGINPPVRDSNDLKGSESLCVIGPAGMKVFEEKVICAQRHIHMSPDDADRFGVINGDMVDVEALTDKGIIYRNVLIRVAENFALEFHIDTDEANAADLKNGDMVRIIGINR